MNNFPTLVDKIYELQSTLPNAIFLRQPCGDTWKEFTYDEVVTKALKIVTAMKTAGLKKGNKIGIYSKNCYEWAIAEIAIMLGGFVTVPFYANLVGEALNEVIILSDIQFLFVGKLDNWEKAKQGIPENLPIVRFSHYEGSAKVDAGISLDEFIKDLEPDQENFRPSLEDIWAIFFTSGTTGKPKGAVTTYAPAANLWIRQGEKHHSFNLDAPGRNTFISYLPLNHIAEQALIVTGAIYHEGQISFVESLYTFAKNLADVKPSIFLAVPSIWTKLKQGVISKTPQLDAMLRMPKVADQVKKKIRVALGLDNTKLIISGASALPQATIEWFQKIGINIQETFGMTEALGIVILQPKNDIRLGRTGKCLEEGEIRIDPDNDEILIKNGWMFKEYYKEPKLTKSSFTEDGFYKTGDTGDLDSDGYLKVKGRVKDAFKTAKGEFIVPAPIESRFAVNDFIEQICIVGLNLPQPIGLVQLSDKSKNSTFDEIKESLLNTLNDVNNKIHLHEKLSKILIISEKWSLENGILTPTNKIKRNVIHETYKHLYENWYQNKNKIIVV
ncbi:MAG: AMP-binding protein [Flavobacteriaceae bacterium]|nr:AMP-binding protein [Flavobacteriaceae bacterium]